MVLEYSSQTIQLYKNGEIVFDEVTQLLPSNNLLENSGNIVINAGLFSWYFILRERYTRYNEAREPLYTLVHMGYTWVALKVS